MGDVASLAVGLHLNAANFKSQLIGAYTDANRQSQNFNRTARQDARKTAAAYQQIGTSITGLAGRLAGLAGAGLSIGSLITINRQYGQSLSDLSAITGATGAELRKYDEAAQLMGRTTEYSASQAVESIKLMASAKPDLMKTSDGLVTATKSALTLAQAAGITLPEATRALALSLNQFGAGADQADRYINVMAAGAKYGSSEITDTAEAIKKGGVAAAQAGIGFESLNAAIQVLAEREVKGADAGTALRNIILTLEKGTDKTLKPSVVGLGQALENLSKKNLSTAQAVKLFNLENINAATILTQNRGKLRELTDALTGTNTAYDQAATRTNNLNNDLKNLTSAFEGMALRIGQASNDTLRSGVQSATEAVNFLTDNFNAVSSVALYTLLPVLSTKLTAGLRENVSAWKENHATVRQAALQQKATAQSALEAAQAVMVRTERDRKFYDQMHLTNQLHGVTVSYKEELNQLYRKETEAVLSSADAKQRLAAANRTLSVSSRAIATAGGLARGALGLLGGPGGIAVMAATALGTYALSADTAADKSKDLAYQVDAVLGKMNQLSVKQVDDLIDKQMQEVADLRQSYLKIAASPAPDIPLYKQLFKSRGTLREEQIKATHESAAASAQVAGNLTDAESRLKQLEDKRVKLMANPVTDKPKPKADEAPPRTWGGEDTATLKKQAITQFAQLRREIELENLNSLGRIDVQEQQARDKLLETAKNAGASQLQIDQLSAQQAEKFGKDRLKLAEQYSPARAIVRQAEESNQLMGYLYQRELMSFREYQEAKLKAEQDFTRQRLQAQANSASAPQFNLAGEVDPVIRLQNQLAQQKALYDAYYADGLISKQRYEELMVAATNQSADQQQSAAVDLYRNQSRLHALQMDLISQVGDRTANMITGILSGQQSFSQAMTNMANTIMDTVVKAFIQAQTQAIMFQMVSGATSMFGGGASAASASSTGSSGGMGMSTNWKSYVPGRATGGSVRGGSLYEMGELGIELLQSGGKNYVVPDRDGNVIPNNKLASGGGSAGDVEINQTVNNYFTINGSGDQALLQAMETAANNGAAKAKEELIRDFRTNGPARRTLGA